MKIIRKHKNIIITIIFTFLIFFIYDKFSNRSNLKILVTKDVFELSQDVISCDFKLFSNFSFLDDKSLITLKNNNQKEPITIIFSGLTSEQPIMKGNAGEDPLIFISETENEINLGSSNAFGDMFFYKIYKKQKVATWYKSYDMFGTPYTLVSMGTCR